MAIRTILNDRTDNATLRRKSRQVEQIDARICTLLDDMRETLAAADGVGLAAPQVGVLRRIAVVDVGDDNGLIELINPVILSQEGTQEGLEGCLSVSDLNGTVLRPAAIEVRYTDRSGQEMTRTAEGYLARAMCHEIDHLDGILFTDTATDLFRPSEQED